LERAILSIRRRLQAHASPATRYSLIGASAILAELQALDIRPLPNPRTIERVLQRHGLTATLQSDIDQYQAQVRRSNQTASEMSLAPAKMSAASAGRKELVPLNQSH